MTSIHFGTQWFFSWSVTEIFPQTFGADRIKTMTWEEWWKTSVPCGVVTSGDVGLSNLSLVRISITFYTMVKASTPIFVLAWAYLFGIERITVQLILVVLIIAAGEFLTVVGEVAFDHIGFLLALSASMLSGARWTLVQLKLRSMQPPIKTTIATMRLLSPSMFFSLFFLSLIIEEPWARLANEDAGDTAKIIGLGLVGAFLAIAMVLCEFYLIMRANAIVLMIGGVIKEMVTIFIGVFYFGDELNKINMSGCFVVFVGVGLYKASHYVDSQRDKEMLASDSARGIVADSSHDEAVDGEVGNDGLSMPKRYEKISNGLDETTDGLFKDNNNNADGLHFRSSNGNTNGNIELHNTNGSSENLHDEDENNGNGLDAKASGEERSII